MKRSSEVTTELLNHRIDDAFAEFERQSDAPGDSFAPMAYAPTQPAFDPLDPLTSPRAREQASRQPSAPAVLGALGSTIASKMQAGNDVRIWGGFATRFMSYNQANADFRGMLASGVMGVDYRPNDRVLLGILGGYERLGLRSTFNSGTLTGDGVSLAAYSAYAFDPKTMLAAQIGTTLMSYRDVHNNVSGKFDAYRIFGSLEARKIQQWDNWILRSAFGYRHTVEFQNSFTQSDGSRVLAASPYEGQFHVRGEAAYRIATTWGTLTPTTRLELQYIPFQSASPVTDSFGNKASKQVFKIDFGTGFDAIIAKNLSVSVRADETIDFNGYRRQEVTGRLRIQF